MARVPASEATRKRINEMLAGKSGVERSALLREAVRLIVEETLEAEVSEQIGRGYCERAVDGERGQRNGYRLGKLDRPVARACRRQRPAPALDRTGPRRPSCAPRLRAAPGRTGPGAAGGFAAAGRSRARVGQYPFRLQAHAPRQRRHAAGAAVAGADTAEPALFHRHQRRRQRAGTWTVSCSPCWPPRSPAVATAASPLTAWSSPGNSSQA